MTKSGKHCGKRRNCLFWAISSFVTMFSKSRLLQRRQKASIWGKGLKKLQTDWKSIFFSACFLIGCLILFYVNCITEQIYITFPYQTWQYFTCFCPAFYKTAADDMKNMESLYNWMSIVCLKYWRTNCSGKSCSLAFFHNFLNSSSLFSFYLSSK